MAEFQTFDLGRAYSQAEDIKNSRQNRELTDLQMQYARKKLSAPPPDVSYDDALGHARIALGAAKSVAANPSDENVRRQYDMMRKTGSLSPDFNLDAVLKLPPEQRVAAATKWTTEIEPFLTNAVEQQAPTKPSYGAVAEGINPATGKPEQFVVDNAGERKWLGSQPIPPKPAAGAQPPAPSYRDIVDPTNPKQLLTVDGRLYRGGGLGSPGVLGIAGKEPSAAKAEETRGTGKASVTQLTSGLRDYYQQLEKGGGIVDTEDSGLSNAVTAAQSSGPGQFVGRVFGTENQSLRNQIKQQRPLLLQAIRQATGMTGKQMDSNVELQLYLSAATDPTLDLQANLSALEKIDELYGTAVSETAAPAEAAPASGLPPQSAIEAELARRRAGRRL